MEAPSDMPVPGYVVFIRKVANLAKVLVKAIFPLLQKYNIKKTCYQEFAFLVAGF